MTNLLLVTPGAAGRAALFAAELRAKGARVETVSLVSDIRELELSLEAAHAHVRGRLPELHGQVRADAAALAARLPAELGLAADPGQACWWQTYSDTFARFYVAPLLLNAAIVRAALSGREIGTVWLVAPERFDRAALRSLVAAIGSALAPDGPTLRVHGPRAATLLPRAREWAAGARALARVSRKRKAAAAPGPVDVCCLAVGATSAPIIARLAARLGEAHGLSALALDLDFGGSSPALARTGVPALDPLTLGASEAWRAAILLQARLPLKLGGLQRAGAPTEQAPWELGWAIQRAALRNAAVGVFRNHCARRCIGQLRPRVLLAFHPYADILSPFVLTARDAGVPCLYLQHGILGPHSRTIGFLPYETLMVFGEYVRQLFDGWADPTARVLVTGHCLYDEASRDTPVNEDVRARLIGDCHRLALVVTQPDEPQAKARQPRWWLRAVAQACRELDTRAVLRLHPQEPDDASYRELLAEFPGIVTIADRSAYGLPELLDAADVVVMRDSTVAYEANLRGRPVITVNLSGQRDRFPIAETGGALGVWEHDSIGEALRRVLTEPATREHMATDRDSFLRLHLGPLDGRATERICEVIAQAARE